MLLSNSLRYRVAFYYALFGAGLSIFLSGGFYLAVQEVGHRLIDQILLGELEEHGDVPVFVPPNEKSVRGYMLTPGESSEHVPPEVVRLQPGSYDMEMNDINYRALVIDKEGKRYFMLYNMDIHHLNEAKFFRYVVWFALFMIVSSSIGGVLLASRVTASVTRLARQVGKAQPGDTDLSLTELTENDEVGDLARAFDRYLRRLRNFVERENYFTADVSHELRTPLAIVLGTIEVLEQDDTLSDKQKERLARIRRAAQDMIDLTAALLLMAREHQFAADEQPSHVGEALLSCVEKHRHLIGDRPIRLDVELTADPALIVERPLLEIVIGNLIRNAMFNTKSGFIKLRLEENRIVVQDSGVGMRPEELARALERYYKGASSAGAGVGLSLVKRICDRYGWRIILNSKEGEGTTAEIDFTERRRTSRVLPETAEE